MPELDVEQANVYYATAAIGPFLPLPEATGYAFTSDTEGETVVRTFGGGRKVRMGDDQDNYEISALFDPTGQSAFRAAKRNKTSIWIALIWDDDEEEGQLQEVKVTAYSFEAEADGDFQRATFTALGEGALSEIEDLPTPPSG